MRRGAGSAAGSTAAGGVRNVGLVVWGVEVLAIPAAKVAELVWVF